MLAPALLAGVSSRAALLTARPVRARAQLAIMPALALIGARRAPATPRGCAAMLRGLSCRLSRYAARARRPLVPRQGRPARGRPPLDKGCRACTYPGPCDYLEYITQTSGKQDVCMILEIPP